jgi:uncharacterized protein YndB with AHSA1/START domain
MEEGQMRGNTVTVERVIPAPPEKIFDLLADPAKHPLIDGSGTVVRPRGAGPGEAASESQRLGLGSVFGMSMKMGLPYSMVNEVVEFTENRRIAWQPRMPGPLRRLIGGRIWRYELEPVDGGTRVRETWDISQDTLRALLRRGPMPETTRKAMEKTLEKIEELVTGPDA